MRISFSQIIAATVAVLALATPLFGQGFNPGPNPITGTVGAQTLSSGTGTIDAGGRISIASGGTVPLTMTGTSTLINNGTIQTLGTGRAIDSNSGIANLTITNTGLISSVSTDAFRVNTNSTVSLTNSGTIQVTAGGQAIDWAGITTAPNSLMNQSTGIISANGEDAVRPGQNGIVMNAGSITATPVVDLTDSSGLTGSDGIDLRTQKTVTVTNTGTISGRHGIATDGDNLGPSKLTVFNNAGTILGVNGSGLNVDADTVAPFAQPPTGVTANVTNAFGAIIKGGVLASSLTADGDGIDVDGVLTLTNSGDVLGTGARGAGNNPEAIAAGGGSITNNATGRIIGSATADSDGDPTKIGNGILIDDSNGGNAFAATTITNAGRIEGTSGFGIKIIGTFNDSVTNTGTIIGGNGIAIDMGAGDDQVTINGGTITGNILGGGSLLDTLTINGNFSYANSISAFGLVDITSGLVTFSGVSDYTGVTRLNGGLLTFADVNRLSFGSSLDMSGGALSLADTLDAFDTANPFGQKFSSFTLSGDSEIDLGFSLLDFGGLGSVAPGTALNIVHNARNPLGYALRFAGDLSMNVEFDRLLDETTVNGFAAQYRVVGTGTSTFTEILAADPVPEPSTLALLGLGGSVLAWHRRRRAAKKL